MTADPRRDFDRLVAAAAAAGPYVAYSGGVDSSLVLRAAIEAHGGAARGLIAATPMHPPEETEQALERAAAMGARVDRVDLDPLEDEDIRRNPPDRCYHCKRKLYRAFLERTAGRAGLVDGTNADDLDDHRPGLRAISELGVATPLADLGITKQGVRRMARMLGLAARDLPSSSCLATRIPAGTALTLARLGRVAAAERALGEAGFSGCRVRLSPVDENACLVELRRTDFDDNLLKLREIIMSSLRGAGFGRFFLDLDGRI